MRIFYHDYTLKRRLGGQRQGALLRYCFPDGSEGFFDCHPWPEYGEPSLEDQLKQANRHEVALFWARLDAQARQEKRPLLTAHESLPKSHLLVEWEGLASQIACAKEQGITHCKIKVRPGDKQYLSQLHYPGIIWRLDANAAFSSEGFLAFARHLEPLGPQIDFVEDPCSELDWSYLASQLPYALAADFVQARGAEVAVYKPTQRLKAPQAARIICTSALGHPLGQLAALYAAQSYGQIGGWLSHFVYEKNVFSEQLVIKNGSLQPVKGTGLGFDELLEELSWKHLPF